MSVCCWCFSYQSSKDGNHPLGKTCIHCSAPLVLVCLSCDLHRQQGSQQQLSSSSGGTTQSFAHDEGKGKAETHSDEAMSSMREKSQAEGNLNAGCKEVPEEVTLTELAPATLVTDGKRSSSTSICDQNEGVRKDISPMPKLQPDVTGCQNQQSQATAGNSSATQSLDQPSEHITDLDSGLSHPVSNSKEGTGHSGQQKTEPSSGLLASPEPMQTTKSLDEQTQAEVLERKLVESTIVVEDSKFYCCIECQQEFQTETRMRLHLQQHLNYRPYVCEYCSAAFLLRNQLNVHILKKHPDLAEAFFLRAKEEDYNKVVSKFLNDEEVKQPAENAAVSTPCIEKAEGMGTLENIVEKSVRASEMLVDGVKGYCCIECGQKFSQRYSMKRHFETHVNYRPNSCPHCPATFHQHYHLQRHIINTHSSVLDASAYGLLERERLNFQARELQFKHEERMFEESMIVVNGVDSFSCRLCGERYSQRSSLVLHIHTHTQDRKHTCKECGKSFKRLAHLKRHSGRMHQSVRSFVCGLCSASFADNYHLSRHEATHTKHQPYKCTDCGAAFTNTRQLKSHLTSHHGGGTKSGTDVYHTQTQSGHCASMSAGSGSGQGEDMTWLNLSARPPVGSKPASIMQRPLTVPETKAWEMSLYSQASGIPPVLPSTAMIKPPFWPVAVALWHVCNNCCPVICVSFKNLERIFLQTFV